MAGGRTNLHVCNNVPYSTYTCAVLRQDGVRNLPPDIVCVHLCAIAFHNGTTAGVCIFLAEGRHGTTENAGSQGNDVTVPYRFNFFFVAICFCRSDSLFVEKPRAGSRVTHIFCVPHVHLAHYGRGRYIYHD